jgi:hypothetical protein
MKIVLVKWLDATRTDDVISASGKIGIVRETVGWLLRKDDDGIVIAFTRDDGHDYERGFTIPHTYIKSVRVLGDG